jgi:DNA-binding SARP family transcriptional activator
MGGSLEIRVLGPFEVVAGGRIVAVSGGKRHGLLALLALRRGRVMGVDEAVDALWGEELPAAPRNALQHHVARLRAALGQDVIVAAPGGYAVAEASVDALRFEEMLAQARAALRERDARAAAETVASALALWRGPALQGLTETAWFSAEARRLEALRVDALEEQFEAALALGGHREIESALRATLEENPFRERLWGQLMLALYRCGRQADALETFQEARRVLAEHLGLEPGPELEGFQNAGSCSPPGGRAVLFLWLTRAREYQIVLGLANGWWRRRVGPRGSWSHCLGWALGASAHAPFLRLSRLLGCAAAAARAQAQRARQRRRVTRVATSTCRARAAGAAPRCGRPIGPCLRRSPERFHSGVDTD